MTISAVNIEGISLTIPHNLYRVTGAIFEAKEPGTSLSNSSSFTKTICDVPTLRLGSDEILGAAASADLFIALVDPDEAMAWNIARKALRAAKQSNALTLLIVPGAKGEQPSAAWGDPYWDSDPHEVDCVLRSEGNDPRMELLAAMRCLSSGLFADPAIAVDFYDLRSVLTAGRNGAMIIEEAPDADHQAEELIKRLVAKTKGLFSVSPEQIAGVVLCAAEESSYTQNSRVGELLRAHDDCLKESGASVLYTIIRRHGQDQDHVPAITDLYQVVRFVVWTKEPVPAVTKKQWAAGEITNDDIPEFLRNKSI